jgi:hypothetical protein
MMSRIILSLLLLCSVAGFSQTSKSGLHYRFILSGGVIAGQSTAKPLYQFSGGITFNRFYTGLGVGIDRYFVKTIPVFADIRYDLDREQRAFVYGNAGTNFGKRSKVVPGFNEFKEDYIGKFYMDVGLGYRFPLNKFHRLALSVGYSRKSVVNENTFFGFCGTGNCPFQVERYEYNLGRIVTKLSWEFGK